MELKQKGSNAVLGSFKQLQVSLVWSAAVDLDLMAFYKCKDGKTGGVWSKNYAGGSMGSLNQFPYIELSGDAGLGAAAGKNREELRISKLDDFEELYIAALNFTDASSGTGKVFADYDAKVEVITDKGETHMVALDSSQSGSAAILCKFKKDFMGASIVNNSDVMLFDDFKASVPGASELNLSSKVILKQKGQKTALIGKSFHAVLRWKTAVDLDLHCFYQLKTSSEKPSKGLLGKIFKSGSSGQGQISFMNRGDKNASPWIYLDKDAGVGDVGGSNEENIYFTRLDQIEHALIAANIFNKPNSNFAIYGGLVTIRGGGKEIEVPLTEQQPGSWCIIARIDNTGDKPQLININQTQKDTPDLNRFI
ncbi:TerD domain-containing protein [Desulfonema limicola]|uniref:TerD domain-containing protein n=1 Tax=Desulfonema limicola TaxID=45656 RepID=A0A975B8H6_9BACT|nr:hypothetical protein [Desulfonema limicola]QTA80540.1 TerD domain-containing protein [Desulfonema limicola]